MAKIATKNSTVNGGTIEGANATTYANGISVAKVGDAVSPHAPFTGLHLTAVMAQGSSVVKINGIAVCREGDLADCGHTIDSGTGDQNVNVPT